MSNKVYTIYLVDDHESTLVGVKTFLESNEAFKVIGMHTSSNLALEDILRKEPDIAIIDFHCDGMDGLQLIESITQLNSSIQCILMSYRSDTELVYKAKKLGAKAFISKGEPNKEILATVLAVAVQGRKVFKSLTADFVPSEDKASSLLNSFQFKPTELTVIHLMLEGCSTLEIAKRTNKTYFSINSIRRDINKKIKAKGFNNFTHFASFAKGESLFG